MIPTDGTILGGGKGIEVDHLGTGNISITTADVTGTSGVGVDVWAGRNVAGRKQSIPPLAPLREVLTAFPYCTMAPAHFPSRRLMSPEMPNVGIYALGAANSTSVSINSAAGAVAGASSGIMVQHTGSGDIAVTAADVTGNNGIGIDASHAGGGAVSFNLSGAVYGSGYGIRAYGPGGVSMTLSSGASVSGGTAAISVWGNSNDTLTLEEGSSITGDAYLNDGDDNA